MGVTSMKALVYDGGAATLRTDYPAPIPDAGECLVRVTLAGVCATDLEMMAGYRPDFAGVLGHEFVGEVEAAPDAGGWVGQRVVGEINIGCGQCGLCRRGLAKHCRMRRTLGISGKDGAFAEYLTLPAQNLHAVPESVSVTSRRYSWNRWPRRCKCWSRFRFGLRIQWPSWATVGWGF